MKNIFSLILICTAFIAFGQDLSQLRRELQVADTDSLRAHVLNKFGEAYKDTDYDSAYLLFRKALAYAPESSLALQERIVDNIAWTFIGSGSYDSVRIYTNHLYMLGKKYADLDVMVTALNMQGVAFFYQLDYPAAEEAFEKSLQVALESKDEENISKCYNNLGLSHMYQGSYEKAIDYFLRSSEIDERMGDEESLAKGYNNIALLHGDLGNDQKALEYHMMSLAIKRRQNNPHSLYSTYNNIALIYKNNGNLPEALKYSEEAIKIADSISYRRGQVLIRNNFGLIYTKMQDYPKAIAAYEDALKFAQEDLPQMAFLQINLGDTYRKSGNPAKGLALVSAGLESALQTGEYTQVKEGYLILSEINRSIGDYKSALENYLSYDALQDSTSNVENLKNINELQTKYETEKKEQELKVLKAESELQALQIRQGQKLFILLILLAAAAIIALVLNNSRRSYKLKAELAMEKELLQKTRFKAVIDAEETERKRIARELHDGLGQLLSTVRLTVSGVDDEDPKIQSSLKLIDAAVQEIRSISHNMMPNALIAYGLQAALEDLVRRINLSGKLEASCQVHTNFHTNESQSVAIYRVVQEVLNNVIKYAEATKVDVLVNDVLGDLLLTIKDNGKGFDTAKIGFGDGIGWMNVQSRMEIIGGDINIFSKLDEGTTVKLTIPNYEQSHQSAAS